MTAELGERLRNEREKRGWSQVFVSQKLGMKRSSTYANWEYGTREPDVEMLGRLAELYEVTTDYLITGDESTHKKVDNSNLYASENDDRYALTSKDERDIARDLERIMEDLETDDGLSFYGEEVEFDEEAKELLRSSLEQSMKLAKAMAKKKFTPKKYRKP